MPFRRLGFANSNKAPGALKKKEQQLSVIIPFL